MAGSKGAKVAELWDVIGTVVGWNFRFERHFNGWELEEAQIFICIVSSKSLSPFSDDRLRWNETKDGIFTIKSSFDL